MKERCRGRTVVGMPCRRYPSRGSTLCSAPHFANQQPWKKCPECDQPMLPKGMKKKPFEFDHASRCSRGQDPTGAKLDKLMWRKP